jgi:hypothetical protein
LYNFIPRRVPCKTQAFKHHLMKRSKILLVIFTLATTFLQAQPKDSLYNKIHQLDSLLFSAYNHQQMPVFSNYFTKDLEWYQDNGGLLSYQQVITTFQNLFNGENKLTRTLVPGTLEVHPIKGYGAIEIGSHRFSHWENGKEVSGTFKFVMVWKQENGSWRISRVVSYDH